jgi:cellulose synthase/poly-beta-1,6-N-acetylglucosamine synthase-like glycosyltransferase
MLMAIEPDDEPVARFAAESVSRLREAGIAGRIVVSDGKLRIKAHALNLAVKQSRGKYCAFYDAADVIDADQVEKAVRLMEEHDYDVMQSAVFRKGRSILSHFLTIDTFFWYRKYLPLLLRHAQGFPLSGEGLFVRKSVLDEVGGFFEVLTEDAYLGLLLTEGDKRFGIVDSVVVEKAPRNAKAHFTQRSRWHRGYLLFAKALQKQAELAPEIFLPDAADRSTQLFAGIPGLDYHPVPHRHFVSAGRLLGTRNGHPV